MAQKYAKGSRAWGICGRSGKKMLLKDMVFDGRFPNMRVDPDWWEDKHPQEYMPKVEDPTALYRPSPEVIAPPSTPVLIAQQSAVGQITVTWSPAESDITEIASYTLFRGVNGATPFALFTADVLRDFLGGIIGVQRCTTTPSIPHDDSSSGSVYDKVTVEDAPVSYVDSGLTQGNTYCYYVTAQVMGNNQSVAQGPPSAPSNTACVTVNQIQATAPVLSVTLDADGARADLSWTASTVLGSTIAHYEVYRSDDGGSTFNFVHETDGVTLAYIDNPTPGAVYYWYVFAVPVLGINSANSNTVSLPISNDPFFADVVLLLHGDSILDSSQYSAPLTVTGNAVVDTVTKKFGTGSIKLPDSSTFTTPHSTVRTQNPFLLNDPLDILSGTEDWTIEGWFNLTNVAAALVVLDYGCDQVSFSGPGASSSGLIIQASIQNSGTLDVITGIVNSLNSAVWGGIAANNIGFTFGNWYHFAVVRHNTTALLYLGGNRVAIGGTQWINYAFGNTPHYVTTGYTATGSGGECPGWVDEIRVTKGIARYTGATYTVPTAPSFP